MKKKPYVSMKELQSKSVLAKREEIHLNRNLAYGPSPHKFPTL